MESEYNALVGCHDEFVSQMYIEFLKRKGYTPREVSKREEFYSIIDNEIDNYRVVIMDPNLGLPGSLDIEPLKRVYESLFNRIQSKEVKLIGFSGGGEIADLAKAEGLPCEVRPNDVQWINSLESYSDLRARELVQV